MSSNKPAYGGTSGDAALEDISGRLPSRSVVSESAALRQRTTLNMLWREGRLSRWELHERTGLNPNAIGLDVAELLGRGIVRECAGTRLRPGRPRVPLEIDPSQKHVIGLSLDESHVEAGVLNLRGELHGEIHRRGVSDPGQIASVASDLYRALATRDTIGVGISARGWVDHAGRSFTLTLPGRPSNSLAPIFDAVGAVPIVLENDMHALSARWLLTHLAAGTEDVLLVFVGDGQLGAALLIEGRPNRGSANSANELGHTRFYVDTERCYCGHPGCLERICSTPFLSRVDAATRGAGDGALLERAGRYDRTDTAIRSLVDYLAMGLANAVNLVRPSRFVLVSELTRCRSFSDDLLRLFRTRLLMEPDKLPIDLWDQPATQSGETAGWLSLASFYRDGWSASSRRLNRAAAQMIARRKATV